MCAHVHNNIVNSAVGTHHYYMFVLLGLTVEHTDAAVAPYYIKYMRLMANTTSWFSLRKRYAATVVVDDFYEDFNIFFSHLAPIKYILGFPVFVGSY